MTQPKQIPCAILETGFVKGPGETSNPWRVPFIIQSAEDIVILPTKELTNAPAYTVDIALGQRSSTSQGYDAATITVTSTALSGAAFDAIQTLLVRRVTPSIEDLDLRIAGRVVPTLEQSIEMLTRKVAELELDVARAIKVNWSNSPVRPKNDPLSDDNQLAPYSNNNSPRRYTRGGETRDIDLTLDELNPSLGAQQVTIVTDASGFAHISNTDSAASPMPSDFNQTDKTAADFIKNSPFRAIRVDSLADFITAVGRNNLTVVLEASITLTSSLAIAPGVRLITEGSSEITLNAGVELSLGEGVVGERVNVQAATPVASGTPGPVKSSASGILFMFNARGFDPVVWNAGARNRNFIVIGGQRI